MTWKRLWTKSVGVFKKCIQRNKDQRTTGGILRTKNVTIYLRINNQLQQRMSHKNTPSLLHFATPGRSKSGPNFCSEFHKFNDRVLNEEF